MTFDGFRYQDHILRADGVSLADIAEKVGTPTFVYVAKNIAEAYQELEAQIASVPHLVCYALKANSNLAVVSMLGQLGAGADIVSGGELHRALMADIPADKIVFSGVGKTKEEIDYALRKRILCFNIESEQELLQIDLIAKSHRKVANVMLRVNPDVNPKVHPYIATGMKKSKFGIPYRKAYDLVRATLRLKNVNLIGLSCHIGSQITELAPYQDAFERMLKLHDRILKLKSQITHLDMGGGLGVVYNRERPPALGSWVQGFLPEIRDRNLTLVLEPGRSLVANAGVLLSRVIYAKRGETDNFIIADAGMNDLIRPALYEAYHSILPVHFKRYRKIRASIVGPCCESGDILTKSRRIQNFQQNDLLAIMSCGAYGSVMSSHYNLRPKAAEVLVRDGRFYVVRDRENYDDLLHRENVPAALRRPAIQKVAP